MAREILFSGQKVSVRLVEEPENAMDRNAISFHVKIGKAWNRIGYVARELTNYVKRAIDAGEIAGVEVKWIRYIDIGQVAVDSTLGYQCHVEGSGNMTL